MFKKLLIYLSALLLFSCQSGQENQSQQKDSVVTTNQKPTPDSNAVVQKEELSVYEKYLDTEEQSEWPEKRSNKTVAGIEIVRVLSEEISEGKFKEIEVGDYGHFNMIDSKGKLQSYFLVYDDDGIDQNFSSKKSKGKKIKLTWQKVEAIIEQSGSGTQVIEVVRKVELIN